MGRLLPSSTDAGLTRSEDATVVFLDDARADEVLSAVQSETARAVVRELLDDQCAPSEIAARIDRSVETVSYHVRRLEERDIIAAVDTTYSEKGREMTVYGIAPDPLFVVFGSSANETQLRRAFSNLAAALGPVSVLLAIKETMTDPVELLELLTS